LPVGMRWGHPDFLVDRLAGSGFLGGRLCDMSVTAGPSPDEQFAKHARRRRGEPPATVGARIACYSLSKSNRPRRSEMAGPLVGT